MSHLLHLLEKVAFPLWPVSLSLLCYHVQCLMISCLQGTRLPDNLRPRGFFRRAHLHLLRLTFAEQIQDIHDS